MAAAADIADRLLALAGARAHPPGPSLEHVEALEAEARALGDAGLLVRVRLERGLLLSTLDRLDEAEAVLEELLGTADAAAHGPTWVRAAVQRADLYARRGRRAEATNLVAAARQRARLLGAPRVQAEAAASLALHLARGAAWDAALPLFDEALSLYDQALAEPSPDMLDDVASTHQARLRALVACGRQEEARREFAAVKARLVGSDRVGVAGIELAAGELAWAAHDPTGALGCSTRGLEARPRLGDRVDLLRLAGRACAALDRIAEAEAHLRLALDALSTPTHAELRSTVTGELAEVLMARGEAEPAAQAWRSALSAHLACSGRELGTALACVARQGELLHTRTVELDQALAALARANAVRARQELDLVEVRERAGEVAEDRARFLSVISHEIRTPLSGVAGLVDEALESVGPGELRGLLHSVRESTATTLAILEDVLALGHMEAGRIELRPRSFKPADPARRAVALVTRQARSAGLKLRLEADALPAYVHGDDRRIEQVLLNLLGNAVKFTPAGEVVVWLEPLGPGRLRFTVRDTGPGIPVAQRPQLFHPWEHSVYRTREGAGLGLAVAARLVHALGGDLEVAGLAREDRDPEDDRPTGAVFRFDVPLPEVEPEANLVVDAGPLRIRPPLRVLVVEDNPVNQRVIQLLLNRLGAQCELAATLAQGRVLAATQDHDLLLIDRHLPDGEGTLLSAELAQAGDSRPRVAMTAAVLPEDREACRLAGLHDFLAKPLTRDAVLAVLDRWLPTVRAWRVANG